MQTHFKKIAKTKSIFVVHAHGDNIGKIRTLQKILKIVLEQPKQNHLIKYRTWGDLLMETEVFFLASHL